MRRHSDRCQRTIARPAEVRGVGFLTGASVRLRFLPAPPCCRCCRCRSTGTKPVRRRPKAPLTGDPTWEGARRQGLGSFSPVRTLAEYVNFDHVRTEVDSNMVLFEVNFRPLALNYWLQNLRRRPLKLVKEELRNEFVAKHKW